LDKKDFSVEERLYFEAKQKESLKEKRKKNLED
jgi:hypothetical protein